MIRLAKPEDINNILSLIMEFYDEGLNEYQLSFNKNTLKKTIKNLIDNHIVIVAIDNYNVCGLISGTLSPSIFDENELISEEKMWFVKKEKRGTGIAIDLLKVYEELSKKLGAKFVMMIHMTNIMPDKVKSIYEKMDYKQSESHYIKNLGG